MSGIVRPDARAARRTRPRGGCGRAPATMDRPAARGCALASAFAALLIGPAPATAASDPCAGSKDEPALLACRQKEFLKADSELNQLVAYLHKSFLDDGAERAATLTKAQSAWRTFRDAECTMQVYESKGSGYESYLLFCKADLTRSRAIELKKIKDNP